jgi:FkbM family methyltransferase
MSLFLLRLKKLFAATQSAKLLQALLLHRVVATTEHSAVIDQKFLTIIDVGANEGQFSLACRAINPRATIIAFEPLREAADVFERVFRSDARVTLHRLALGSNASTVQIHISARRDSSSLLGIAALQTAMFPGTDEVGVRDVSVKRLDEIINTDQIARPALLKIDVQGFELEVLSGATALLGSFDMIYCECSFVELYRMQPLAHTIISMLSHNGFILSGVFNTSYSQEGLAIQADLLFVQKIS